MGREETFSLAIVHRAFTIFFNLCIFVLEYPTGTSAKEGGLGRVITELTNVKRICTLIIP